MTETQQLRNSTQGRLFGVPLGDLGWFASLLMTLACGFIGFFAATFLGIFGVLIYGTMTHSPVNYAITYLKIGIPVGVVVLVVVGSYLGTLWVKRISRSA